jgi:hypothetical protein
VADCLANRVSVLFTDRGPFREYEVLAEGLRRLGRSRYIPRTDLLEMDLRANLEAILDSKATWSDEPTNGAEVVAERVVETASI